MRARSHRALCVALLLAACSPAAAQPRPGAGATPLAIRLTPARAHMGDVIALEADVDHDEGARVSVPRGLKLAPFEVLRRRKHDSDLPGGRVRTTVRIELIAFGMGEHVVPPIELRLVEKSGRVRTLRTDPGRIMVVGLLDDVDQAEPKQNHGPVPVMQPRTWPLWVGLAVLGALLLALVVAWAVRRHARLHPPAKPAPPPRPPWEIALEKLAVIRGRKLAEGGQTKEHYDAVSDVVRDYLGALGGFAGLDMTTEEILAELRRAPPAGVGMSELLGFFAECDLVKFAKATATPEQAAALVDMAVTIVQRTRAALVPPAAPVPVVSGPAPQPPAPPPAEAA